MPEAVDEALNGGLVTCHSEKLWREKTSVGCRHNDIAMVAAPPAAAGGSQTAFTYSSEPQAVPPKRSSVRSKYREDAATTPDAAQWIDENDVGTLLLLQC